MRPSRVRACTVLSATAVLCAVTGAAQPASAAEVSFQEFINRVTVTAKDGETNRVRVTVTANEVRITDTGAPLVDLAPTEPTCKSLAPNVITCDRIATEVMRMQLRDRDDRLEFRDANDDPDQPLAFSARGGAGDDRLASITPTVDRELTLRGEAGDDQLLGEAGADRLEGGSGADTLTGRAGRDRLDGGTGKDTFFGGPGADTVLAKDGTRDKRLDCGTGADSLTRDVLLDPAPIGC
jgi:hypothetical protein